MSCITIQDDLSGELTQALEKIAKLSRELADLSGAHQSLKRLQVQFDTLSRQFEETANEGTSLRDHVSRVHVIDSGNAYFHLQNRNQQGEIASLKHENEQMYSQNVAFSRQIGQLEAQSLSDKQRISSLNGEYKLHNVLPAHFHLHRRRRGQAPGQACFAGRSAREDTTQA